jgi:hypothetical protein
MPVYPRRQSFVIIAVRASVLVSRADEPVRSNNYGYSPDPVLLDKVSRLSAADTRGTTPWVYNLIGGETPGSAFQVFQKSLDACVRSGPEIRIAQNKYREVRNNDMTRNREGRDTSEN